MKAPSTRIIPGKLSSRVDSWLPRKKLGRKRLPVTLIPVTDQQFERAVSEHYADVFRFALSLSKKETEACDLAQEAFRRLASKGHQIQDESKLKSWLMTTCYREFLREHRHRVRFPHVEISLVEDSLPNFTPNFLNEIDASAVMEALLKVDEIFRVPLMLFYIQAQSYKEIAELLEVPAGTVMSRLARGKAQLRELLVEPIPSNPPALPFSVATAASSERPYD